MPIPGVDCHVVIDSIGYVFADVAAADSEARQEVTHEQVAPFFGDPVNVLDPLSSDLTMLLPIGQNDFSDGMGATDLETNPHGYERGENLIVTPQKTLVNGPVISTETFATTQPTPLGGATGPNYGWFSGGQRNSVRQEYIVFSDGSRYYHNGTNWADLAVSGSTPSHLDFHSGKAIVAYSSAGCDIIDASTVTAGQFDIQRTFIIGGKPFVINKDGRIYAAYLARPPAPSGVNEAGAIVAQRNWVYHIAYVLPGGTNLLTELSPPFVITKTANQQIRLTLPARTYRGGPVSRWLIRSVTDTPAILYVISDHTVLNSLVTNYADAADDAAITGLTQWNYSNVNSTSIALLTYGVKAANMAFPDTDPMFMPESVSLVSTGATVNNVQTFKNLQGNEAAIIGSTVGLFLWDGNSRSFQRLNNLAYNPDNCRYVAINHGVVYYSIANTKVKVWNPDSESDLLGPWTLQFSSITDIRIQSAGLFVFFAVSGVSSYASNNTCIIYAFDGKSFVWATRLNSASTIKISMGELPNRFQLVWYDGITNNKQIKYIDLSYPITSYQQSGVLFRSGTSDLNLPRLRKQIHGVMVRYSQLTAQITTTLANPTAVNDVTCTLTSATGFAIGDWLCIKEGSLKLAEYRKITNVAGNVVTFTHVLGAGLIYAHAAGLTVARVGAVVSIRNVFTDTLPTQNIEVGGPCAAGDIFSLMMLPQPVYSYADSVDIAYNNNVIMEIQGWSVLTALNPEYNGLLEVYLRLQDNIRLPNGVNDTATAGTRKQNLIDAYTKGTVVVIDPLNRTRTMRFQRLTFSYEEPPERHNAGVGMRATAHIRLIDQTAELMKQETLTLTGLSH